jgi:hypothetical protein
MLNLSYNLNISLNNFKNKRILFLETFNKKQENINFFNCDNCSENLSIYWDVKKLKYFVDSELLEQLRTVANRQDKVTTILNIKFIKSKKQIKTFKEKPIKSVH